MPRQKGGARPRNAGRSEDFAPPPRGAEHGSGAQPDLDEELNSIGVPLNAVVKVWCVHSLPNFSLPWQRRRQERSTGSGFCIDLKRRVVLTNAHCVEYHAQVKLQRRGSDTKHIARVLSVGWECDLAVLTTEDDDFWEDMEAVQLCEKVPRLEDDVLCVGFPVGGDTISVTSGVISRIEVTTYTQANADLLGIQIDAAINSGNSGGPAFNGYGECLGVAFQSLGADEAENIGYVIPTVVVMHFLNDLLKNGKYTGFPTLGIEHQTMENAHLRDAFGMADKQKGILVTRVCPASSAAKVLKPGDVLLAFDGEEISNDATVKFRKHERVLFSWLVASKFYGDKAKLSILRDKQRLELEIDALVPQTLIVPIHLFEQPSQGPAYLVVGGLVFTTLSEPFLESEYGPDFEHKAPIEMVRYATQEHATYTDQQLVVLTQVLAHEITVGYEALENLIVKSVNGTAVRNLPHTLELLDGEKGPYITFGMENDMMVILRAEEARKATPDVLEKHGIPADMSPDLVTARKSWLKT
eukprot:TRINITY_DN22074_c0_g1_i1.p1 TRINITY_DN22074_c0_g1~~TRINITY_DN22074_c0_g1_i1.p1  ORF type:complete len:526 (+),score=127.34 TRINITY_DN22074_c0_g1_i1:69-1646(+)